MTKPPLTITEVEKALEAYESDLARNIRRAANGAVYTDPGQLGLMIEDVRALRTLQHEMRNVAMATDPNVPAMPMTAAEKASL